MQEDFEPRAHDHLVEPMFAGLGVGDDPDRQERPPERLPSVVARFLARLRRFLRMGPPAG